MFNFLSEIKCLYKNLYTVRFQIKIVSKEKIKTKQNYKNRLKK